jgi:hypothetical protein
MSDGAVRTPCRTLLLLASIGAAIPLAAEAVRPSPAAARRQAVSEQEIAAIRRFEQKTSDYAVLHRRLESGLPPRHVSRNLQPVLDMTDRLARLIRAERKQARQGDIFSADVAAPFRRRIAASITPQEIADILSDHDGVPIRTPPPKVNRGWPEGVEYIYVPARMIAALPPLPPELQYRLIGRSLVLWDHRADLVIDVLPGAIGI